MTWIKQKSILMFSLLIMPSLLVSNYSFAAEKQAGKTLLTRGNVISKRLDSEVVLKRRSVIFENDEIHVGKSGRAQFRMIDKALISLQENTVLQIKKYQYDASSNTNSALLELLSGGLRTITGAIGKGNKEAYELRTPLATIGIRGTDYEVEIVPNGMYVAVWDGVIHLKARAGSNCNLLLGKSQPFMFIFIDQLGRCNGLDSVPEVFERGHSSNIKRKKLKDNKPEVVIADRPENPVEDPLLPEVNPPVVEPPIAITHNALVVDQSKPAVELDASASVLSASDPKFTVGLNTLNNTPGGVVENFQQAVGGYPVSWGYWGEFSSTLIPRTVDNSTSNGLIWATYDASDPSVVAAKTGSFTYSNIVDSLLSGSAGPVSNLQIQMDVNFESGNVTNGALSANTSNETWVAVFDGQIQSGDLDLNLNGASVINSDPESPSPPRDASGFISGDFIGTNAEAIIGAFGLSEDKVTTPNHIEGVFIVE